MCSTGDISKGLETNAVEKHCVEEKKTVGVTKRIIRAMLLLFTPSTLFRQVLRNPPTPYHFCAMTTFPAGPIGRAPGMATRLSLGRRLFFFKILKFSPSGHCAWKAT